MDELQSEKQAIRKANRRLALYLVGFMFISSVLFIVNVGMVFSLYSGIAVFIPESYSVSIGQLVLLLGPFILLFLEWYLYDLLAYPFKRRS